MASLKFCPQSLAKLKERSETIVRLEGELINLSAEFANETRKLSVEGEEKDVKINNLKWLVETLEQNKRAMQDKVDKQQKTISDQEKRMKEQDALFKLLTNKKAVEKDNENLRMQIMRLEEKVSELEGKISDLGREKEALQSNVNTLTAQLQSVQESKQQLEEEKSNIEQQKQAKLEQTICKNAALEIKVSELQKEKAQFEEQLEAMKEERKTHEENQRKLESRLSTAINKKKNLENDVAELQKQAQALEGNRKWELAGIDGTLKETFLTIMEMLEKGLYAAEGENESLKRQLKKLTLSYDGQADQMEELQLENDFLEKQNRELRFINRELEEESSKVARLKEESIQSKVEFASDIVKAFEDSEKKYMKTGSLTLLNEELGASVEKLSDQLYKVKSMERQQFQSTQGSQQQSERETIDLEGKLKIEQSQKEQKQIEKLEEKDAQCKQLKESLCALEGLEYRLESLESQSTTTKAQQRKNSSHQINIKSITKSEADLSHEKKASFVKKRKNNPYNEKYIKSYTDSLPLKDEVKTKYTPNSFLSCTSSTASIKLRERYSRPLA